MVSTSVNIVIYNEVSHPFLHYFGKGDFVGHCNLDLSPVSVSSSDHGQFLEAFESESWPQMFLSTVAT